MKDPRLKIIYDNLVTLKVIHEKLETVEITHSEKRGVSIIASVLASDALRELNHLREFPDNKDDLPF